MLLGSLVGPGFLTDVWAAETLECPRGDVTGDPRCEQRPGGTCPRESLRDAEESQLRPQGGGLGARQKGERGLQGRSQGRCPRACASRAQREFLLGRRGRYLGPPLLLN